MRKHHQPTVPSIGVLSAAGHQGLRESPLEGIRILGSKVGFYVENDNISPF
jgi:hypothetical protein